MSSSDISIINAKCIKAAHNRLIGAVYGGSCSYVHQCATDSIDYVLKSMEKQNMWFTINKSRKDDTMNLVYNLVTQQDAANNIQLGSDMKRDSTSMNSTTVLTMVFLPGTFTTVSSDPYKNGHQN